MSNSHFDESHGVSPCLTPWGKWWQTVNEVYIEVNVAEGTRGSDCIIRIEPKFIECRIKGKEIFSGPLFKYVHPEASTWTIEEKKTINILLDKAEKYKEEKHSWTSLLEKQYVANPLVQIEMKKQLDLEKLQIETPGFNFAGAEIKKSYESVDITNF